MPTEAMVAHGSALLRVLVPLAASAMGGAIGFFSALGVAGSNARREAENKLRAGFAPELAIVRATPPGAGNSLDRILGDQKKDVSAILEAAFIRHATAVAEYRFFVPNRNRAAYDAAWLAYYLEDGKIGFVHYMYGDDGSDLFDRQVEAILKFTRQRFFKFP